MDANPDKSLISLGALPWSSLSSVSLESTAGARSQRRATRPTRRRHRTRHATYQNHHTSHRYTSHPASARDRSELSRRAGLLTRASCLTGRHPRALSLPRTTRWVTTATAGSNPACLFPAGIGDTTEPLPPSVAKAMSDYCLALGTVEGYSGYDPPVSQQGDFAAI